MATNHTRKAVNTRIYGCGGLAINLLSRFEQTSVKDGLNHLKFYYVDTSGSNLNAKLKQDSVYLFKDMDGGGKDRRLTYPQIAPFIPDVLEKMPPGDFNIVLHSSSGGSGACIGPALVADLLKSGQHVVVLQVGSVGSKIEVGNTMGAIKSYALISKQANRPVISYYRENNERFNRGSVDEHVLSALFMVSLLFSNENDGLDTADLQNLLDYQKVTSFGPELSSFDFFAGALELPTPLVGQSSASLFSRNDNSTDGHETGSVLMEYRAEGFLSEHRAGQLADKAPIHYAVYTGDFTGRLLELGERLKRFETAERGRANAALSVTVKAEEVNDSGMVY